jgi:hypothetical protein
MFRFAPFHAFWMDWLMGFADAGAGAVWALAVPARMIDPIAIVTIARMLSLLLLEAVLP